MSSPRSPKPKIESFEFPTTNPGLARPYSTPQSAMPAFNRDETETKPQLTRPKSAPIPTTKYKDYKNKKDGTLIAGHPLEEQFYSHPLVRTRSDIFKRTRDLANCRGKVHHKDLALKDLVALENTLTMLPANKSKIEEQGKHAQQQKIQELEKLAEKRQEKFTQKIRKMPNGHVILGMFKAYEMRARMGDEAYNKWLGFKEEQSAETSPKATSTPTKVGP